MKKKGFTLIELLAVIVILAIIALIATPLVLKYIETARKDTFKNSIESVERAAQLKVVQMGMDKSNKYPVTINVQDLDLKNKEELIGSVTIYKNNNGDYEYSYNVTNKDYSIIGKKDSELKKDYPILKLKTEHGIIDDINNYVYSFYTEGEARGGYEMMNMSEYFEVENGSLEFEKNIEGNDSTGSKLKLKDKNDNVVKEYTVIIFGDVDYDGYITSFDGGDVISHVDNILSFNELQKKAADVNNDGVINRTDGDILINHEGWLCHYNQYTNICEDY